jgi:hypothetical protein
MIAHVAQKERARWSFILARSEKRAAIYVLLHIAPHNDFAPDLILE